jgi:hypothetical protein
MLDDDSKPISLKHQIWLLLLGKPNITVEQIQARILHDNGTELSSKITVSSICKTYRDVLRFLVAQNVVSSSVLEDGMLKSVTAINRDKPISRDIRCQQCDRLFTPHQNGQSFLRRYLPSTSSSSQ